MIHPARIHTLNDRATRDADADYVLYWMQQSQRTSFNPALEHAISIANERELPLLVCFGLMDDYPEANARHYAFMLEGLRDVAIALAARKIAFVVLRGQPADVAVHFSKRAACVVCDRGYLRHQKRWRDELADQATCAVVQVEGDVVVPVDVVSDHHEFAARTIRPKIHRAWDEYLVPMKAIALKRDSLRLQPDRAHKMEVIDVSDPARALERLKVDRKVPKSEHFIGGEREAQRRLGAFIQSKLRGYDEGRNEPAAAHSTMMSAYLHFGQISPLEMALAVRGSKHGTIEDRASLLEELIVRRELSMNFVEFNASYDRYEALPTWARKTLAEHAADERPIVYTLKQLEQADTHDRWWNAAQQEMLATGFMHNYMRMYWGKKILEWTSTPEEAFETTLYLNNKYFLCGRDANAYANVAWVFGLHDRPWGPARKIFGTVRYMNAAGLERKFDMAAYALKWIAPRR